MKLPKNITDKQEKAIEEAMKMYKKSRNNQNEKNCKINSNSNNNIALNKKNEENKSLINLNKNEDFNKIEKLMEKINDEDFEYYSPKTFDNNFCEENLNENIDKIDESMYKTANNEKKERKNLNENHLNLDEIDNIIKKYKNNNKKENQETKKN